MLEVGINDLQLYFEFFYNGRQIVDDIKRLLVISVQKLA